jgi:hypothetical protein
MASRAYRYGKEASPGGDATADPVVSQARRQYEAARLHHLCDASRTDRPARRPGQMDRLRADVEPADRGARAKLAAHQGAGSALPEWRWRSSRPIPRTTRCSPTARARSPISTRNSCRSATTASIIASPSTAAIRRPTGRICIAMASLPKAINPPNGWAFNTNDWPWTVGGPGQPEGGDFSTLYGSGRARIRAARMPICCWTGKRDFTPQTLIDAAYDQLSARLRALIPLEAAGKALMTQRPIAKLAAPDRIAQAAGIIAGAPSPHRPRSRSSGAKPYGRRRRKLRGCRAHERYGIISPIVRPTRSGSRHCVRRRIG